MTATQTTIAGREAASLVTPADGARAKAWRLKQSFTVDRLSELSGYSVSAIFWMEKGLSPPQPHRGRATSRAVNVYAFQRYRRVCHSVQTETRSGKAFDW